MLIFLSFFPLDLRFIDVWPGSICLIFKFGVISWEKFKFGIQFSNLYSIVGVYFVEEMSSIGAILLSLVSIDATLVCFVVANSIRVSVY